MTLDEWLGAASEDAERRQLPELVPRLAALAAATRRLRAAAWNREAVPPGPTEARAPETADRRPGRNREPASPPATETRAPETVGGFPIGSREPAPPGPADEP